MSEMIERVAKAIDAASQPPGQKDYKLLMENAARAAIEAMREPTEAMATAGAQFAWFEGRTHDEEDAATTWRAMIDEALQRSP